MKTFVRWTLALCWATLAAAMAVAQTAETPLKALPYSPSLDPQVMDRSVNPCDDLYQFSCGGWIKANPIPPDQARWSVYSKLANDNQRYLWGVLQGLANRSEGTADQRKLGDYFAACMDETAVNAAGAQALAPLLARIQALTDKRELPALLAELHRASHSDRFFFGYGSGQALADPTQVIAFVSAGGISLPDRDDYLRTDARSRQLRADYLAYLTRSFALLGDSPAQARANARSLLATETALARARFTRVQQRDPYLGNNPSDVAGLQRLTPGFDWRVYREALGAPPLEPHNVTEPKFLRAFNAWLAKASVAQIQTYLRGQLVASFAPVLSQEWAQAHFDFFDRTLQGTPQRKARWKQCVQLVDAQLGEALGREYVERTFSPEIKANILKMGEQIEAAMAQRLRSLSWMSEPTKLRALEKVKGVVNKIGYPDVWRDYSAYAVQRTDFAGNVLRGNAFEVARDLAKIGQPLDRGEWAMTPQTVNAYYDPLLNSINFPAAVLQPPLYDPRTDAAPNYGNTGGTIGHELIHGFDDEGRQFDAQGRLEDWWTTADAKAFQARASCVAKQYAGYTVVDNIKINSALTLGEDLADLGGLVLAWVAWQSQVAGQTLPTIDGLTPEQRFFVGFAQWDCGATRDAYARVHARTDPHSPSRYRINGVVVNMPEFEQAFACKPGNKLVKPAAERCVVW